MDMTDLRSLSVVLTTVAFLGVCWWAFSPSRKKRFEDAANLPFADDKQQKQHNDSTLHSKNEEGKK